MSQALMEEAPAREQSVASEPLPPDHSLGPRWLPPLVLVGALAVAAFIYAYFWQHSRELWWWMGHDRHTHYMFGLNLALDLGTGNLVRLFHDIDRMRVWGPLHPFLVAFVELAAGPDHR